MTTRYKRDQGLVVTAMYNSVAGSSKRSSAESPSKVASAVASAAGEENPTSANWPPWSSG